MTKSTRTCSSLPTSYPTRRPGSFYWAIRLHWYVGSWRRATVERTCRLTTPNSRLVDCRSHMFWCTTCPRTATRAIEWVMRARLSSCAVRPRWTAWSRSKTVMTCKTLEKGWVARTEQSVSEDQPSKCMWTQLTAHAFQWLLPDNENWKPGSQILCLKKRHTRETKSIKQLAL